MHRAAASPARLRRHPQRPHCTCGWGSVSLSSAAKAWTIGLATAEVCDEACAESARSATALQRRSPDNRSHAPKPRSAHPRDGFGQPRRPARAAGRAAGRRRAPRAAAPSRRRDDPAQRHPRHHRSRGRSSTSPTSCRAASFVPHSRRPESSACWTSPRWRPSAARIEWRPSLALLRSVMAEFQRDAA